MRKCCIVIFIGLILFPPFHNLAVGKFKQDVVDSFFERNTSFVLSPPSQGNLRYAWTINWGRLLIELAVVAGLAAVVVRSRRILVAGTAFILGLSGGVMVYVYDEEKFETMREMIDKFNSPPDRVEPPQSKLKRSPEWKPDTRPVPHPKLGPATEPIPLPADLVAAWDKGGFDIGWMDLVGDDQFYGGKIGKPGQVPTFRLRSANMSIADLPAPDTAFGLVLNYNRATDAALKDLTRLKNLRALRINGDLNFNGTGLIELAELEQLQYLHFSGIRATDASLMKYLRLSNLLAFHLSYATVTDAGLQSLAGMTKLQSLNLGHIKGITDAGLKELSGLKDLQWLSLTNTGVTDAGLKELVPLKKLQYLELANVAITDLGLEDLKQMSELRHLNIMFTSVSAEGVESLHSTLPNCKIYGYWRE